MPECMNTVSDLSGAGQAVCVSVRKIMDACRDQDCMENLPVYLTAGSQEILEQATSVRARSAQLLYADVETEPVPYQEGYYCLTIQYYYRILADATMGAVRPAAIYGLCTTSRQAMLYGGQGESQSFRSNGAPGSQQPVGVVEAVDPVILCSQVVTTEDGTPVPGPLPEAVLNAFDEDLPAVAAQQQLQVTLGQFSLIRLERDTQMLLPSCSYCVPEKGCSEGDCGCAEDPCETFSRMQFPVGAFFPGETDGGSCGQSGCCGAGDTAAMEPAAVPAAPPRSGIPRR